MLAVHIHTDGMYCEQCPPRIEAELQHLPGVKDAHSYRSMRLTSVLFDPELIDVGTIRDRIVHAGFKAQVIAGGHPH